MADQLVVELIVDAAQANAGANAFEQAANRIEQSSTRATASVDRLGQALDRMGERTQQTSRTQAAALDELAAKFENLVRRQQSGGINAYDAQAALSSLGQIRQDVRAGAVPAAGAIAAMPFDRSAVSAVSAASVAPFVSAAAESFRRDPVAAQRVAQATAIAEASDSTTAPLRAQAHALEASVAPATLQRAADTASSEAGAGAGAIRFDTAAWGRLAEAIDLNTRTNLSGVGAEIKAAIAPAALAAAAAGGSPPSPPSPPPPTPPAAPVSEAERESVNLVQGAGVGYETQQALASAGAEHALATAAQRESEKSIRDAAALGTGGVNVGEWLKQRQPPAPPNAVNAAAFNASRPLPELPLSEYEKSLEGATPKARGFGTALGELFGVTRSGTGAMHEGAAATDELAHSHTRATGTSGRMREALVLFHEFLRGDWKRGVGSATIELQNFGALGYVFNPITIGIAAVAGAMAVLIARSTEIDANLRSFNATIRLTGTGSQETAQGLENQVERLKHLGLSAEDAKKAVDAAARTPGITPTARPVIEDIGTRISQYLGDERAPEHVADLAKATAGGVEGLVKFGEAFNAFTENEIHAFREMNRVGEGQQAINQALDILDRRLPHTTELFSPFHNAIQDLKNSWDQMLTSLSKTPAVEGTIHALTSVFQAAATPTGGSALAGGLLGGIGLALLGGRSGIGIFSRTALGAAGGAATAAAGALAGGEGGQGDLAGTLARNITGGASLGAVLGAPTVIGAPAGAALGALTGAVATVLQVALTHASVEELAAAVRAADVPGAVTPPLPYSGDPQATFGDLIGATRTQTEATNQTTAALHEVASKLPATAQSEAATPQAGDSRRLPGPDAYGPTATRLVDALIQHESRGEVGAVDKITGTHFGLGQLALPTANEIHPGVTKEQLLTDAGLNREISTEYLRRQITAFGNLFQGLEAYRAGPGAVRREISGAENLKPAVPQYARDIIRNAGGGLTGREDAAALGFGLSAPSEAATATQRDDAAERARLRAENTQAQGLTGAAAQARARTTLEAERAAEKLPPEQQTAEQRDIITNYDKEQAQRDQLEHDKLTRQQGYLRDENAALATGLEEGLRIRARNAAAEGAIEHGGDQGRAAQDALAVQARQAIVAGQEQIKLGEERVAGEKLVAEASLRSRDAAVEARIANQAYLATETALHAAGATRVQDLNEQAAALQRKKALELQSIETSRQTEAIGGALATNRDTAERLTLQTNLVGQSPIEIARQEAYLRTRQQLAEQFARATPESRTQFSDSSAQIAEMNAGLAQMEQHQQRIDALFKGIADTVDNVLGGALRNALIRTPEEAGQHIQHYWADLRASLKSTIADIATSITQTALIKPLTSIAANALGLGKVAQEIGGFATGGSMEVGGSGGTDSQHVQFMATPGERVIVLTPAQAAHADKTRQLPHFAGGGEFDPFAGEVNYYGAPRPVDDQAYAEPTAPAPKIYWNELGQAVNADWTPAAQTADTGFWGSAGKLARGGLAVESGFLLNGTAGQPLVGIDQSSGALTGRLPVLADFLKQGIPGGGNYGALSIISRAVKAGISTETLGNQQPHFAGGGEYDPATGDASYYPPEDQSPGTPDSSLYEYWQKNVGDNPAALDVLATISKSEGTFGPKSYNTLFGGQTFEGDQFPQWAGVRGSWGITHAAGAYQMQPKTAAGEQQRLNLPDFSKWSQDIEAWDLALRTYSHNTKGGDLQQDWQAGAVDYSALGSEWASFKKTRSGGPHFAGGGELDPTTGLVTYYNDAGQPFTLPEQQGPPVPPQDTSGPFSSLVGLAQKSLQGETDFLSTKSADQPLLGGFSSTGEFTGRIPALADFLQQGLAGGAPGGARLGGAALLAENAADELSRGVSGLPAEEASAGNASRALADVSGGGVRPAIDAGGGGRGGAFSAEEAQRRAEEAAGGYAPLEGLPQKPIKIGDQFYVPGPLGTAKAAAAQYVREAGLPYNPPTKYQPVDIERATRIADEFDAMKHDPGSAAVKASYDAMAQETLAQWQTIKGTGLKVEWIKPGQTDPYAATPRLAAIDVAENNHWWGFPTDLGFGTGEAAAAAVHNNPMLQLTGEVVDGRQLMVNDVFRIVHDYFGHFKEGVGFRAAGEENAWLSHSAMYSDEARGAMTSETRGQNSWVNYGPNAETNRTASAADTVYAPQKIGLLPEWVQNEGRLDSILGAGGRGRATGTVSTVNFGARAAAEDFTPGLGHNGGPALDEEITQAIAQSGSVASALPAKVPGISGLTNPLPIPSGYARDLELALSRGSDIAQRKNPALQLEPGVYVGDVNFDQWLERVQKHLTPDDIAKARGWYDEALPAFKNYFGDRGPQMMGAWLTGNVNATPSFAQLSATRILEQTLNKTPEFSPQKRGGLAHDALNSYWQMVLSTDPKAALTTGEGSGVKIYDFIDSALGKTTRTFFGDDPRAGAPAVADVHSLRDMGYVDEPLIDWVSKKYGEEVAAPLRREVQSGPSPTQYESSANQMRAFTQELNDRGFAGGNWTPAQLQAVGWTTMSRMLGRGAQTAQEAIEAHVRNLSYELDFGKGAPMLKTFPEWEGMADEAKAAVTREILPKIVDYANSITGAQEFARVSGTGGWGQFTNPSFKSRFVASPEVAGDTADLIGYLAEQTKVFGYRWMNTGKKVGVAVYGDALADSDKTRQLWDRVTSSVPDLAAGFSPSEHLGTPGIEIMLDKGGAAAARRVQGELFPAIDKAANDLGIDVKVSGFRAEEASREHDWTQDETGRSYLDRLGARYGPALPARLEVYKREELIPAIRDSIDRNTGTGPIGGERTAGGAAENVEPGQLPLAADVFGGPPPLGQGPPGPDQTNSTEPAAGGFFSALTAAPGFAAGTTGTPPGWILVGEEGPEWLHQAGGATVLPHGVQPGDVAGRSFAGGTEDFSLSSGQSQDALSTLVIGLKGLSSVAGQTTPTLKALAATVNELGGLANIVKAGTSLLSGATPGPPAALGTGLGSGGLNAGQINLNGVSLSGNPGAPGLLNAQAGASILQNGIVTISGGQPPASPTAATSTSQGPFSAQDLKDELLAASQAAAAAGGTAPGPGLQLLSGAGTAAAAPAATAAETVVSPAAGSAAQTTFIQNNTTAGQDTTGSLAPQQGAAVPAAAQAATGTTPAATPTTATATSPLGNLSSITGALGLIDKLNTSLPGFLPSGLTSGAGGLFGSSGFLSSLNPFATQIPASQAIAQGLAPAGATGNVTVNGSLFGLPTTATLSSVLAGAGVGFGAGSLLNTLVGGNALGGTAGSAGGGLLGSVIGSLAVPGIGTLAGGLLGGLLGGGLGGLIGGPPAGQSAGSVIGPSGQVVNSTIGGSAQNIQASQSVADQIGSFVRGLSQLTNAQGQPIGTNNATAVVSSDNRSGITVTGSGIAGGRFDQNAAGAVTETELQIINSLTNVSGSLKTILANLNDPSQLQAAVQFADVYDRLNITSAQLTASLNGNVNAIGPFQQAMLQVNSTFSQLEGQAGQFGESIAPINAAWAAVNKTLVQDFGINVTEAFTTAIDGGNDFIGSLIKIHQQFVQNTNDASALTTGVPTGTAVAAAAGSVSTPAGQILVGELGPEWMLPAGGTWTQVGLHGPELIDQPGGAIILPNPLTPARAYAQGTIGAGDVAGQIPGIGSFISQQAGGPSLLEAAGGVAGLSADTIATIGSVLPAVPIVGGILSLATGGNPLSAGIGITAGLAAAALAIPAIGVIGGLIGLAANLFGPKPSNRASGDLVDLASGDISGFQSAGDKNADTIVAQISAGISAVAKTFQAATGGTIGGAVNVQDGARDGIKTSYAGPFGNIDEKWGSVTDAIGQFALAIAHDMTGLDPALQATLDGISDPNALIPAIEQATGKSIDLNSATVSGPDTGASAAAPAPAATAPATAPAAPAPAVAAATGIPSGAAAYSTEIGSYVTGAGSPVAAPAPAAAPAITQDQLSAGVASGAYAYSSDAGSFVTGAGSPVTVAAPPPSGAITQDQLTAGINSGLYFYSTDAASYVNGAGSPVTVASATGSTSTPPGPILVGEEGPEWMLPAGGSWKQVGLSGPEVIDQPGGAQILPAGNLPKFATGTTPPTPLAALDQQIAGTEGAQAGPILAALGIDQLTQVISALGVVAPEIATMAQNLIGSGNALPDILTQGIQALTDPLGIAIEKERALGQERVAVATQTGQDLVKVEQLNSANIVAAVVSNLSNPTALTALSYPGNTRALETIQAAPALAGLSGQQLATLIGETSSIAPELAAMAQAFIDTGTALPDSITQSLQGLVDPLRLAIEQQAAQATGRNLVQQATGQNAETVAALNTASVTSAILQQLSNPTALQALAAHGSAAGLTALQAGPAIAGLGADQLQALASSLGTAVPQLTDMINALVASGNALPDALTQATQGIVEAGVLAVEKAQALAFEQVQAAGPAGQNVGEAQALGAAEVAQATAQATGTQIPLGPLPDWVGQLEEAVTAPLQLAIQKEQAAGIQRVQIAQATGADLVRVQQENADAIAQIWYQATQQLTSLKNDITTGSLSGLTPANQVTASLQQFNTVLGLVQGGNTNFINELASAGQAAVQAAQQAYGNGPQTASIREQIYQAIQPLLVSSSGYPNSNLASVLSGSTTGSTATGTPTDLQANTTALQQLTTAITTSLGGSSTGAGGSSVSGATATGTTTASNTTSITSNPVTGQAFTGTGITAVTPNFPTFPSASTLSNALADATAGSASDSDFTAINQAVQAGILNPANQPGYALVIHEAQQWAAGQSVNQSGLLSQALSDAVHGTPTLQEWALINQAVNAGILSPVAQPQYATVIHQAQIIANAQSVSLSQIPNNQTAYNTVYNGLPAFAGGTTGTPPGIILVGEKGPEEYAANENSPWQMVGVNGPELLDQPGGATILPFPVQPDRQFANGTADYFTSGYQTDGTAASSEFTAAIERMRAELVKEAQATRKQIMGGQVNQDKNDRTSHEISRQIVRNVGPGLQQRPRRAVG